MSTSDEIRRNNGIWNTSNRFEFIYAVRKKNWNSVWNLKRSRDRSLKIAFRIFKLENIRVVSKLEFQAMILFLSIHITRSRSNTRIDRGSFDIIFIKKKCVKNYPIKDPVSRQFKYLCTLLDVNQLMEPTYDESIGKEELAEKEGKNR